MMRIGRKSVIDTGDAGDVLGLKKEGEGGEDGEGGLEGVAEGAAVDVASGGGVGG